MSNEIYTEELPVVSETPQFDQKPFAEHAGGLTVTKFPNLNPLNHHGTVEGVLTVMETYTVRAEMGGGGDNDSHCCLSCSESTRQ